MCAEDVLVRAVEDLLIPDIRWLGGDATRAAACLTAVTGRNDASTSRVAGRAAWTRHITAPPTT